MQPERLESALNRVIRYCESILRYEGRPSDDHIETCERVLQIISEELNKK